MRAELILSSGEQYGSQSVEFRLALLAQTRKLERVAVSESLVSNLLMGIFFASSIDKLTDDSREKGMKHAGEMQKKLFDLLSMIGESTQSERERRDNEARRLDAQTDYAKALGSAGSFKSLDQLQSAISSLNAVISDINGGQQDADAKSGAASH